MNRRQEVPPSTVVVPRRPGPLVRLGGQNRDEVDEFIDDLFGQPDKGGPGVTDAVLLVGGTATVIAAINFNLPSAVLVVGVAALGLGLILPVRSLVQRVRESKREARLKSLLGNGTLLNMSHPTIAELVDAHDRVLQVTASWSQEPNNRVNTIAHELINEVATLLDGESPVAESEATYVAARTDLLWQLVEVSSQGSADEDDPAFRRAIVEARLEVEAIAGESALIEAARLVAELGGANDEPSS